MTKIMTAIVALEAFSDLIMRLLSVNIFYALMDRMPQAGQPGESVRVRDLST
ncbi:MAG: hypothetical protein ACLRMZ_20900 [Blautia marasmi]